MMYKILSFFKRQWVQMVPVGLVLVGILVGTLFSMTALGEEECPIAIDYTNYNGYNAGCDVAVGIPLLSFMLLFLLGSLSLSFVRRKIVGTWALFALPYIYISMIFLSKQSTGSMMGPDARMLYAGELGLALSVITIIWVIVHSWILRKKNRGTK